MNEILINTFKGIPPEVATIILAMIPIIELRGALPTALVFYGMPVWKAVVFSIIGNMIPVYFLLLLFEQVSEQLRKRSTIIDKMFDRLIERVRRKLANQVDRYGVWALAIFVAIPLPVTGAWTGTLAAFIFGLSKKKSFLAIFMGLIVASIVVTFLTLATVNTVNSFH